MDNGTYIAECQKLELYIGGEDVLGPCSRKPAVGIASLIDHHATYEFAGARVSLVSSRPGTLAPSPRVKTHNFSPIAVILLSGKLNTSQSGRACELVAGTSTFLDASRAPEFCGEVYNAIILEFPRTAFAPNLFAGAVAKLNRDSPMDKSFVECVQRIYEAAPSLRPLQHSATLGALICQAVLTSAFLESEKLTPVRVVRAMAFIENNLGETWLNPQIVADAQQVSRRYLDDLFGQQDHSIESWIRERRLQRSVEELRMFSHPRRSAEVKTILQISLDLGFRTPSHFSKCFAQRFGQPPRKFKKMLEVSGDL